MPKKLHDKVNELLESDSFYPEKSEKEREELAWPIATNILKESSFNFKNYRLAQTQNVNEESFKSKTLSEFATKFFNYAQSLRLRLDMAYNEYAKRATYNDNKLSGYKGFKLFQNYLTANVSKALTVIDLTNELKNLEKDESNFVFNESTSQEAESAQTGITTPAKGQGITGDTVIQNLPGAQKIPGNSGATGIQNIIQYTSQSAARAPKTEEQIAASERMFMMDNTDALRILSRNIYDVNALRNFEKDLTFSKNHFGTRFEAPVNSMLDLYGQLATTNDRKEKNKIGAQIQYIIQNQLLGSGVRPSVLFNSFRNPNNKTDYLYSAKQAPTPYQFRYLEDVYNGMLPDLRKQFEEDRKAFADQYKKDNPNIVKEGEELPEDFYPENLKLAFKPGTPTHQRTWTEGNGKQVLKSAFGEEQPTNAPSNSNEPNPAGTMTFNSSPRNPGSQLNAPETPDPKNIDKSNLSGMLGRPQVTNPNPTKPSPFNLQNTTPAQKK